ALHVPLHFVVYDTGRKLNPVYGSNPRGGISQLKRHFPHLSDDDYRTICWVRDIYSAWMEAEPDASWLKS
ncbi:hypothetical protein C8Q80DRAFT_1076424, partial [Daedaleopsis nitida]